MDPYALHLVMAALAGASLAAISAYYVHRKSLADLLDFALAVERGREQEKPEGEDPAVRRRPGSNPSRRKRPQVNRRAAAAGGEAVKPYKRKEIPVDKPRGHALPEDYKVLQPRQTKQRNLSINQPNT